MQKIPDQSHTLCDVIRKNGPAIAAVHDALPPARQLGLNCVRKLRIYMFNLLFLQKNNIESAVARVTTT